MFCCSENVARRRVDDDDAMIGGGVHVDVIHAYACSGHDAKLSAGRENGSVHFRLGSDNEGMVIGNRFDKLVCGEASAVVNVVLVLQKGKAIRRHLLRDQNPGTVGRKRGYIRSYLFDCRRCHGKERRPVIAGCHQLYFLTHATAAKLLYRVTPSKSLIATLTTSDVQGATKNGKLHVSFGSEESYSEVAVTRAALSRPKANRRGFKSTSYL
ncbi:hypothetical protein CGGC5_v002358 [Colletotrichum fructicola Nara gc5]|uniref:Uncharacterized protein n=1 Tax=Colletotrichum fructicola (strain Nara gc5) TaxID=1213859 RepID=A0A7J6JLW8_COLFN|nr:hypothetical protein CGGC5_v002358 [Colletotrichum fructicola Nara gc5]